MLAWHVQKGHIKIENWLLLPLAVRLQCVTAKCGKVAKDEMRIFRDKLTLNSDLEGLKMFKNTLSVTAVTLDLKS